MSLLDYLNALGEWVLSNMVNVLSSLIVVVVGYVVFKIIDNRIKTLKDQERLEEGLAYNLSRLSKWIAGLAVTSAILGQFGVTIGVISGLLTVLGGTIIGFAAINTIGNAIAGLIVMSSRPFSVGDRIFLNGQFVDVVAIELIYTKMMTLDNVLVSVPNQELLKAEIDNFGKKKTVRRHVTVTPGFEYNSQEVEEILLKAADQVPRVLKNPKPYVWVTRFQNYAVEYTLYVFINDVKGLPEIDAELHRIVLENCKRHNIDISTPTLIKSV